MKQTEGQARCIAEPRGANGLEGYVRGSIYRFAKYRDDDRVVFKVYPADGEYAEVCGPTIFSRFFQVVQS